MKQYDKEGHLIYIHVPKCGGTSILAVLEKWFNENFYKHYYDEKNNKMPPKYNLRSDVCICGHFNKKRQFGIMDYYPEADQFVTILRDPFERVASIYFYVKRVERERKEQVFYFNGKPLNLGDDVNSYLKQVISNSNFPPNLLDYMPYEMNMNNYKEILEKNFIYIGVTEDLQTSIDILANNLGFPTVKIEYLNTSERYQEIEEGLKEEFIMKNPLEYAIYDYALKNYKC